MLLCYFFEGFCTTKFISPRIWYFFLIDHHVIWIEVCQNNRNLLVVDGCDKNVKIFEKRESKFIRTFEGIHNGNIFGFFNKLFLTSNCYWIERIFCVQWNPSGDQLVSASFDKTVALLDCKTGKKALYWKDLRSMWLFFVHHE